ncbi:site-specific integrase [Solitalea lacus]|uniref:site-specific integrase n=1 Tax=Solitalea lacus TaxID=2911172 RepID=UPI001EDAFEF7|nr:site-specific integrase [Solitalea lacus]UKJ09177.1 site-specific integrase [Solitalea lacus]
MNKTFNLLFYVKRNKLLANGTVPIYLRITIDGKQTEIASKRYIEPKKWNRMAQKVNGNSEEVKSLNAYLKTLEQQAYEAYHALLKKGSTVTTVSLKNKLLGSDETARTLIPIFEEHNQRMEALLGQEYSAGTLERYKTSLKHTTDFLNWKFNLRDIDIRKIDHHFITEYEFYLRSIRKCSNNTAVKYIKNFGKIIRICLANGWLDKNPFINYKAKIKEVVREYLTAEEIQSITNKEFSIERLSIVRDIFLFSCFTGLAYADVKKLKRSEIQKGIDDELWIYTSRKKTDTTSRIPLLPSAIAILNRYQDNIECEYKDLLLPVLSNQKMNAYLKEIADLCGIKKQLTYHIARHTFATTVTLSNGVPIESVSKMLGHINIKTTQHYAKILDIKVSEDMKRLKLKLKVAIK